MSLHTGAHMEIGYRHCSKHKFSGSKLMEIEKTMLGELPPQRGPTVVRTRLIADRKMDADT